MLRELNIVMRHAKGFANVCVGICSTSIQIRLLACEGILRILRCELETCVKASSVRNEGTRLLEPGL
jgi:hypothetical protein